MDGTAQMRREIGEFCVYLRQKLTQGNKSINMKKGPKSGYPEMAI